MDFDANLFINFIPLISAALLTFVTCFTVICKIKNRWPIKVNCWFCNENAKVHRQSINWWLCPHCEQYNGFSKEGDYNYEIPEQHKIINKNFYQLNSYCQRKSYASRYNSLCKQCNRREELKLLKLRELEDCIDGYNDKQIARFGNSFEKKYPLCLKCQSTVHNVLQKQALWLAQYKMLFFKQKPIKRIIQNQEMIERILRIVLSILASVSIYFTEAWYLPLCGIIFQIAACLASNKWKSDIFPIFGWVCLILVKSVSIPEILKMLKLYSNQDWMNVDDFTYRYFIITLGTVVGLANLRFQSHKSVSNGTLTFKKLKSPNKDIFISRSPSPKHIAQLNETCNEMPKRNFHSPINITDTLMTPASIETPIPLKPEVFQRSFEEKRISLPNQYSYAASVISSDLQNSFSKNLNNQTYSLNDSLSSLNSLTLGTQQKSSLPNSPKIFETKIYGTTSPDLFTKHLKYAQKRSILAPPKLRSVTQTSWVAGGYWQSGMDAPTLSRSSSQSSGFGSSGSNCGPSREPSINEFDQCSVLSEQCCFARPESPLSVKNSTVRRSNCSPRCSQMSEMNCSSESIQCHSRNDIQCSGHTTIITNPAWLPALLCGSLIFNMVVLCAILFR